MQNMMYQVSTLQALALGYSRAVVNVGELLKNGDTGLGTFEDVNGEMILMDGQCYRADQNGSVSIVPTETGVPFAAVTKLYGEQQFPVTDMPDITAVRTELTRKIEERFGLNSMHVVRIDGVFGMVDARSEAPYRSHHVTLKEMLGKTQKAFVFENTFIISLCNGSSLYLQYVASLQNIVYVHCCLSQLSRFHRSRRQLA